jgi:hypothetical protein
MGEVSDEKIDFSDMAHVEPNGRRSLGAAIHAK